MSKQQLEFSNYNKSIVSDTVKHGCTSCLPNHPNPNRWNCVLRPKLANETNDSNNQMCTQWSKIKYKYTLFVLHSCNVYHLCQKALWSTSPDPIYAAGVSTKEDYCCELLSYLIENLYGHTHLCEYSSISYWVDPQYF